MKKLQVLALTSVFAAFGLMTACGTDSNGNAPSVSSPVYISGLQSATDTTQTLDTTTVYHLTGTVVDVQSWSWTVVNASGATVATLTEPAPSGSGDTKLGSTYVMVTFTPKTAWGASGIYTLKGVLTGTDGSTTTTVNITFKAKTAGGSTTTTPLTSQGTLSVGGFNASAGSFIGLGTNPAVAYKSAQTQANAGNIDLVVTANADGSAAIFESTAAAVSNSDLVEAYWGNGRATKIAAVTTAPTTLEAAKLVSLTAETATITSGGIYVVKTVDNVYAVLTATGVTGIGDNVSLTVNVLK